MVGYIEKKKIAKRYAQAFLSLVVETGTLSSACRDMKVLNDVLYTSKELSHAIESPIFPKGKIKSILLEILQKVQAGESTRGLIITLCKNRRAFALNTVIEEFECLVMNYNNIAKVDVTCASQLSKSQKVSMAEALTKLLQREVKIQYGIDESLIGGLVLRIGSIMFDTSIKTKLEKLQVKVKVA